MCLGDAGVALGARRLGQRLVRGLADRVAAELPPAATHFEQAEIVELAEVRDASNSLAGSSGERLQRLDGAGRSQRRRVLEDLALSATAGRAAR